MRVWERLVKLCVVLVLCGGVLAGCGIPEEKHNAVVKDLEDTQIKLSQAQKTNAEQDEELKRLKGEAVALDQKIKAKEAIVAKLVKEHEAHQKTIDGLRGEVSIFQSKTGGLEKALKASKEELAELRKAREIAERRAREYRQLTEKLASMVQSGQLSVKIRRGKMVIQLADNILFDPGKTQLKDDGRKALEQIGQVLGTIKGREFLVAGHTDNVPIKSGRFSSNWELSTARAVKVVEFLQEKGVDPKQLGAAGYGEHDPAASNDTPESRALNRRIEIILMPNLDELPALPADLAGDTPAAKPKS